MSVRLYAMGKEIVSKGFNFYIYAKQDYFCRKRHNDIRTMF